jgi:hypothetical protein
MSDTTDLLIALRDVGLADPPSGEDAGEARVRVAIEREIAGPRRAQRLRRRLPFHARRITLLPAVLAVTAATTAAAATVAAVQFFYQTKTPVMTACEGAATAAPSGILLSCANTSVREINDIRWHGWGDKRVTGTGTEMTMNWHSYHVHLLLDQLGRHPEFEARGALYRYARLVISAPHRPTVVLRLTTDGATRQSP